MATRSLIGACMLTIVASLLLAATQRPATISSERCNAAFAEHRLGGHEFRSLPRGLRVREVRGRVTNEVGGWPEGTRVIFQIFGPATRPVVRMVIAGSDGAFRIDEVPPGEYCFEASAEGWDPVEGLLAVGVSIGRVLVPFDRCPRARQFHDQRIVPGIE